MTLPVQILGGTLIVLGIYLVLAKALGTEGSVQLPGVAINVPSSVLVLLLGVAIFLFPLSPWWPAEGETPPTTLPGALDDTTTTEPVPTTEPDTTTTTTGDLETTTTERVTTTTTEIVTLPASVLQDCISYDPDTLELEDLGDLGWRLNSSTSAMLLADDLDDAERALALARLHTQRCFIGRDNTRTDRPRYILTFWTGPAGAIVEIPEGSVAGEDCIGFDPNNLSIEDLGDLGWRLNSGSIAMVLLDNESDALTAMELATHYQQQCFIGRDTNRADRYRYIEDYWK